MISNRELAKIAKKQLEVSLTKEELDSIAASPKSIALFNQIINRHGRLEIKATVDDIGFMRANLAFSALAAGLGLHQTVMAPLLKKGGRTSQSGLPATKKLKVRPKCRMLKRLMSFLIGSKGLPTATRSYSRT